MRPHFQLYAREAKRYSSPLRLISIQRPITETLRPQTLGVATFGCPVGKRRQAVAIFPGELKELRGVQIGGFGADEGLKPPLDVRAVPGMKTVAAGGEPVELEEMPHRTFNQQSL
jgi:hypothetical protein